jgi:tetratricopeptide (TPR) repeat protein
MDDAKSKRMHGLDMEMLLGTLDFENLNYDDALLLVECIDEGLKTMTPISSDQPSFSKEQMASAKAVVYAGILQNALKLSQCGYPDVEQKVRDVVKKHGFEIGNVLADLEGSNTTDNAAEAKVKIRYVECDICGDSRPVGWDPDNGFLGGLSPLRCVSKQTINFPGVLWCDNCLKRICDKHITWLEDTTDRHAKKIEGLDRDAKELDDITANELYKPVCPQCDSELLGLSYREYKGILDEIKKVNEIVFSNSPDRKERLTRILGVIQEDQVIRNHFKTEYIETIKKLIEQTIDLGITKLLFLKGVSLQNSEQLDEAIDAFDEALSIDPQHEDSLFRKGFALCTLGRHKESIMINKRVIDLNPEHAWAWYNIACSCVVLGIVDKGIGFLEKAIKFDDNTREHAKGDKDFEAVKHDERFKKLVGIKPD